MFTVKCGVLFASFLAAANASPAQDVRVGVSRTAVESFEPLYIVMGVINNTAQAITGRFGISQIELEKEDPSPGQWRDALDAPSPIGIEQNEAIAICKAGGPPSVTVAPGRQLWFERRFFNLRVLGSPGTYRVRSYWNDSTHRSAWVGFTVRHNDANARSLAGLTGSAFDAYVTVMQGGPPVLSDALVRAYQGGSEAHTRAKAGWLAEFQRVDASAMSQEIKLEARFARAIALVREAEVVPASERTAILTQARGDFESFDTSAHTGGAGGLAGKALYWRWRCLRLEGQQTAADLVRDNLAARFPNNPLLEEMRGNR